MLHHTANLAKPVLNGLRRMHLSAMPALEVRADVQYSRPAAQDL